MFALRSCLTAALLLFVAWNARAQRPTDAFVAAERNFARTAAETSVKAAFLGSMADSGIVFHNGQPAFGKATWQKQPEAPADAPKLIWGPEFADAAPSGDLGYTTGPFYIEQPDGKRVAHGHYFTVWGKQPDGSLKFLTDIGIPHAAPASVGIPTDVAFGSTTARPAKARRADVLALEQQLTEAIARQGMAPAYRAVLSAQGRLHREDQQPFTTVAAIEQELKTEPALRFQPRGTQISTDGTLAYAYGTYQTNTGSAQGDYAHVWKHEPKGWRLVAEVLNATKPAKTQQKPG